MRGHHLNDDEGPFHIYGGNQQDLNLNTPTAQYKPAGLRMPPCEVRTQVGGAPELPPTLPKFLKKSFG